MTNYKRVVLAAAMMSAFVLLNVIPTFATDIGYNGEGLEDDGKFHLFMAPPKTMADKYTLNEKIGERAGFGITAGGEWGCNESFTACKLVSAGIGWTDEEYEIVYEYDEEVDVKIDAAIENFEMPEEGFLVYDTELIKRWVFGGTIADNSSEFKAALRQYNMDVLFVERAGADEPLETHNVGTAEVYYNGVLYAVIGGMEFEPKVVAPHIFYVPTGTSEDEKGDALIDRFVGIYGEDVRNVVSVLATDDKARDFVDDEYTNPDAFNDYLDETVYEMNIDFGGMGDSNKIIIVADSDKMNDGFGVDSTDLATDVNIKTGAVNLPGDAMTYAFPVNEYIDEEEKKDWEERLGTYYAYEIGLRSSAVDDEITDVDEGESFKVSIPVPASLEGITRLSAYWMNFETNEPEEHYADILNGMAVFETDHFSTYILAESSEDRPEEESGEESDESEEAAGEDDEKPEPGVPGVPNTGTFEKLGESLAVATPILGIVFAGLYISIKFTKR